MAFAKQKIEKANHSGFEISLSIIENVIITRPIMIPPIPQIRGTIFFISLTSYKLSISACFPAQTLFYLLDILPNIHDDTNAPYQRTYDPKTFHNRIFG
jgi:hypothetical protein